MLKRDVLNKLNWFFSLEVEQVDLYLAQSRSCQDKLLARLLEHVSQIEQGHADAIAGYIRENGGEPTSAGEAVAELLGRAAGQVSGMASPEVFLKLDIRLEQKAMSDYKALIDDVGDPRLEALLWDHLIDEDLHAAWFAEYIKGRTGQGFTPPEPGAQPPQQRAVRRLGRLLDRQAHYYRRMAGLSEDGYVARGFARMAGHSCMFRKQLEAGETAYSHPDSMKVIRKGWYPGSGRGMLVRSAERQRQVDDCILEWILDGDLSGGPARIAQAAWLDGELQRVWLERKSREEV